MPQCRHSQGSCDVEQTAKAKNYDNFSDIIKNVHENSEILYIARDMRKERE
jgi:hypothetical protein